MTSSFSLYHCILLTEFPPHCIKMHDFFFCHFIFNLFCIRIYADQFFFYFFKVSICQVFVAEVIVYFHLNVYLTKKVYLLLTCFVFPWASVLLLYLLFYFLSPDLYCISFCYYPLLSTFYYKRFTAHCLIISWLCV